MLTAMDSLMFYTEFKSIVCSTVDLIVKYINLDFVFCSADLFTKYSCVK